MADVKWIKITVNIFDDEKILLIESLPDADAIIVIWFKLLCLAGKQNNHGVFMLNDSIPYTDEMLATIFRRKVTTVKMALETFERFGMIARIDGAVTIPKWGRHQSLDQLENRQEYMREYMRDYRQKQKGLTCKVYGKSNSKANVSALEKDIDIEKDKEYILCSPDGERKTPKEENQPSEPDARTALQQDAVDFEKIYAVYPKKRGKAKAFEYYRGYVGKGRVINGTRHRLNRREIYLAVKAYVGQMEEAGTDLQYYKNFDTFMNKAVLDYLPERKPNDSKS